jgi:glutamine amidotransferase
MNIVILDYPGGNVRSVANACQRLGYQTVCTADPDLIRNADKVIFPGVGAAGATMAHLRTSGLDRVLVALEQPVLAICVGMQVLCTFSEEDQTECLGLFPQTVRHFPGGTGLKIPHMGWNKVAWDSRTDAGQDGFAYYVHSYFVELGPETLAVSDYGIPFSAVLEKDNFLACQFHPEKSGAWGAAFLQNFLKS